eukprot:CAMPEP_0194719574 /NCGR_PEP_ID=MMETSP0296-20130528/10998_1 /TAXON_ID=39354 /ORGANISM="Heterosigma akashiwo, Strain CCMP2393" /LENGTH=504 /DNA_ID=CAMNT_0039621355 /DNA_START=92 /DNA_END=1609 /DNA_ORIENTATION=+
MDLFTNSSGRRGYGSIKAKEEFHANRRARLLKFYQKWVFASTFIAYACYHFMRKTYTNIRRPLVKTVGISVKDLNLLDSIFLASYSIGNVVSGQLGDRFRTASVVAYGLWGTAICNFVLFGSIATGLLQPSRETTFLSSAILLWMLNGLFQSAGGPNCTAIMGSWMPSEGRGIVFGFWTCHQYFGNLLSATVAGEADMTGLPWWWAVVIAGVAAMVWAGVCLTTIPSHPDEKGLTWTVIPLDQGALEEKIEDQLLSLDQRMPAAIGEEDDMIISAATAVLSTRRKKQTATPPIPYAEQEPVKLKEVLKIPAVALYTFAFGFLKLTDYVIFFWLPYVLSNRFKASTGNWVSAFFDLGMMPGGVLVGWAGDRCGGRRATVCAACLVALVPLLLILAQQAQEAGPAGLSALLFAAGVLTGGPNNIITSAVAADLAGHPRLAGGRALGTVTGVINGGGGIIAALGLGLIPILKNSFGWVSIWYYLSVCVVLCFLSLTPVIFHESRKKQ